MSKTPHNDDGKPIYATRGRPPKPPMSEPEFARVLEILSLPRRARGSSLEAAALEVSLMRGCHTVTDKRSQKSRTVSGKWILTQLTKRGITGKKALHEKMQLGSLDPHLMQNSSHTPPTGTRLGLPTTVQESPVIVERSSEPGQPTVRNVVESEPKVAP